MPPGDYVAFLGGYDREIEYVRVPPRASLLLNELINWRWPWSRPFTLHLSVFPLMQEGTLDARLLFDFRTLRADKFHEKDFTIRLLLLLRRVYQKMVVSGGTHLHMFKCTADHPEEAEEVVRKDATFGGKTRTSGHGQDRCAWRIHAIFDAFFMQMKLLSDFFLELKCDNGWKIEKKTSKKMKKKIFPKFFDKNFFSDFEAAK